MRRLGAVGGKGGVASLDHPPSTDDQPLSITADELAGARARIRTHMAAMRALVRDVGSKEPYGASAFPPT